MTITKYGQEFHEQEANQMFPAGCKCSSTNGGGDCDWCRVYYGGPSTVPCLRCFEPIPATEGTCPHCGYVEFKDVQK